MAVDLDAPVKLEERTVVRKGLNGLRSEGMVPAVIHNHGQPSVHVMGGEAELGSIYKAAGKHHPLQLQIGSQKYLALIKDAHFNPVKRRLQHIVFQAINQNEKVEAEIPIVLDGEIPAEKTGLMVLRQLDHVEVEALPRNLPDELKVSAEKLVELHDKVTVADIEMPEGVTLLTDPEHPIALVVETKAQMSEEEAAEGEESETTEDENGETKDESSESAESNNS
jgi:large subunit ribosomal protein L25